MYVRSAVLCGDVVEGQHFGLLEQRHAVLLLSKTLWQLFHLLSSLSYENTHRGGMFRIVRFCRFVHENVNKRGGSSSSSSSNSGGGSSSSSGGGSSSSHKRQINITAVFRLSS